VAGVVTDLPVRLLQEQIAKRQDARQRDLDGPDCHGPATLSHVPFRPPPCGIARTMIQYSYKPTHTHMALNIRNAEAERLAAELARRTGETKTEAVTQALRERLARVRRERTRGRLADELEQIAEHCANLPVLDSRSADEILGYDEHGLPR